MFEEHLLGGSVHFNDFFQNFSCRTDHNFARKQNSLSEHIKILPRNLEIKKIGLTFHKCRPRFYLLNRLKFVNYRISSIKRCPLISATLSNAALIGKSKIIIDI